MNKKLGTIHTLILNGGCKSKLLLAFKNASNMDEAGYEDKIVNKAHSYDEKNHKFTDMLDKNGWVG